jgi:hypothetical protein
MSNLNKRIIDEINLKGLTESLMEKCGASVTIKKQNVSLYAGAGEFVNQVLIYFFIKTKEKKQIVFVKDDHNNCFKLFKDQLPNKISTFSIELVNLMDIYDHKKGYYTNENVVDYNKLKDCCFVRIKGYELSSDVFKYTSKKKEMFNSNKLFSISKCYDNYLCKYDTALRNVVEVIDPITNKKLKFVSSDVEFVFPDFERIIKNHIFPKDRTFKTTSIVRLKDNRSINIPKHHQMAVNDLFFDNNTGRPNYVSVLYNKQKYIIKTNKLKVI